MSVWQLHEDFPVNPSESLPSKLIKTSNQRPCTFCRLRIKMSPLIFLLVCFIFVPSSSQQLLSFNASNSPWQPAQNTTLVSPSAVFAAGFLPVSAARPTRYYFSVWFIIPQKTVVWTANLDSPVDANSSLSIAGNGGLRLIDSSGRNIWPDPPSSSSNSTELILTDLGNLVFGTWSSFANPTDTILPNQSIADLSSRNRKFSFKNRKDLVYDTNNYTFWSASNLFLTLGADGIMTQDNGAQVASADFGDRTLLRRLTLDDDGNLRMYSSDPAEGAWTAVWQALQEVCRVSGTCGPNAICMNDGTNSNVSCVCPPGFRGPDPDKACLRNINMTDLARSKFIQLDYVNFSGGSNMTDLKVLNYSTCESKCLTDQTCLGFQFKYDGTGFCILLDRLFYGFWSPGSEAAFFLRVDSSETATSTFIGMTELLETTCPVRISLPDPPEESDTTTRNIAIICTLFAAELISGVVFFWRFLKKYIKYRDMARTFGLEFLPAGGPKRFSFAELKAATNDFSNLVGKGGFGDVYKGELSDHRVVAVKCLKNVAGGDAEFWAEVTIIARMHHLNLVRLWGFCAEKGQRILVYEYVPNGSLDKYLFRSNRAASSDEDADSSPILDWNIRYRIALGVARAIAYLHEECLEWVLHCDIKPENILLGDDFCPKISDFGLAKLRKKEDMVSMSRIRGTRGYLAPEWIKMDPITPKADVYSFGMVLLEIVSGVRNFEIQGSAIESEAWYFPVWAFDKVFKDMKVEDLLDRQIKHCYDSRLHFDMVDRMVKTAMWCLQDRVEMRPSMGKVAKMLEGTVEITEPKKPTIFFLSDES